MPDELADLLKVGLGAVVVLLTTFFNGRREDKSQERVDRRREADKAREDRQLKREEMREIYVSFSSSVNRALWKLAGDRELLAASVEESTELTRSAELLVLLAPRPIGECADRLTTMMLIASLPTSDNDPRYLAIREEWNKFRNLVRTDIGSDQEQPSTGAS